MLPNRSSLLQYSEGILLGEALLWHGQRSRGPSLGASNPFSLVDQWYSFRLVVLFKVPFKSSQGFRV